MGSSQTRTRTCVPCVGTRILNHCTTREVPRIKFWCQCFNSFFLTVSVCLTFLCLSLISAFWNHFNLFFLLTHILSMSPLSDICCNYFILVSRLIFYFLNVFWRKSWFWTSSVWHWSFFIFSSVEYSVIWMCQKHPILQLMGTWVVSSFYYYVQYCCEHSCTSLCVQVCKFL